MNDFTTGAHECFCDRQYKDANKFATCGDCPRDYIAGAWDARRKYLEEHSKMTERYTNIHQALEVIDECADGTLLMTRDRCARLREATDVLEDTRMALRYAVRVWVLSDEIEWTEEEIDKAVEHIIDAAKKEAGDEV